MKAWLGIALVAALATIATPAASVQHDRNCMVAGGFFVDAGDTLATASALGGGALVAPGCTGEMLVNVDNDDFYFVDVAAANVKTQVTVTACPTATKTAPWNPNLMVHVRPTGLAAGTDLVLGQSNNANGCDSVNAVFPLMGMRVTAHVNRATGDGLYSLRVTLA